MTHKQALQAIAGMKVERYSDYEAMALDMIDLAVRTLAEPDLKGEARKVEADRKRAQAAIVALERVLANPQSLRTVTANVLSSGVGQPGVPNIPDSLMPAVEAELARMRAAVASPDALRLIYRRNEARRGA